MDGKASGFETLSFEFWGNRGSANIAFLGHFSPVAVVSIMQAVAIAMGAWNTATVAALANTPELSSGSRTGCCSQSPVGL